MKFNSNHTMRLTTSSQYSYVQKKKFYRHHQRYIHLFLLTCLCFVPTTVFSDSTFKTDTFFSITTGDKIIKYDIAEIDCSFDIILSILSNLSCTITIETDRYSIETNELSIHYNMLEYFEIKAGLFENVLTLDARIQPETMFFATISLLSELLRYKGITSNTLSLCFFYRYDNKKTLLPLSYFLTIKIISKKYMPQIDAVILYHFNNRNSYIGGAGSWCPAHYSSSLIKEIDVPLFLINTFIVDYAHAFIYGFEVLCGNTIIESMSYIIQPYSDNKPTFFLAGDCFIGLNLKLTEEITWTPLLRYSIFFPEITHMENIHNEIIAGNKLTILEKICVNIDGGVRLTSCYLSDTLYTRVLPFWEISIKAHL